MRRDWEMHFVDSAAAALEIIESQPFDAVVSDMRMPVKDGAQLLEEVKERYPDVVRMILSASRALRLEHCPDPVYDINAKGHFTEWKKNSIAAISWKRSPKLLRRALRA